MNEEILIELGSISEETNGVGGEAIELQNHEKS
jgi:hypothetical protein